MDDFASASMLRLLLRGMAVAGLDAPLAEPEGARAPLIDKRLVVARIVEAGGLGLLLRLARGVEQIEGEPLHRALIGAHDPHDFHARWQRLERYVHASHRVVVHERAPRALVLQHRSVQGQPAPLAAESVAVLGTWIGALEAIGSAGLRVQVAGRQVHPTAEDGVLDAAGHGVATWSLQWSSMRPRQRMADGAAQADLGARLPGGATAHALARWLVLDPCRGARLGTAAAALGTSARTLQRRLAEHGVTFGEVIAQVRVHLAADWLVRSPHGLADIGYLCGYADQPHFTREFTRRAGLSPARYRQASAPGARVT